LDGQKQEVPGPENATKNGQQITSAQPDPVFSLLERLSLPSAELSIILQPRR